MHLLETIFGCRLMDARVKPGHDELVCANILFHTVPRSRRMFCARFGLLVPPSSIRGRRECRMPDAPAASCALWVVSMHTSIHSESPESPGIPRAMVYGLYRALPGDRLSCHRRRRSCLHRLDTSVGVSGPHVYILVFGETRRS